MLVLLGLDDHLRHPRGCGEAPPSIPAHADLPTAILLAVVVSFVEEDVWKTDGYVNAALAIEDDLDAALRRRRGLLRLLGSVAMRGRVVGGRGKCELRCDESKGGGQAEGVSKLLGGLLPVL